MMYIVEHAQRPSSHAPLSVNTLMHAKYEVLCTKACDLGHHRCLNTLFSSHFCILLLTSQLTLTKTGFTRQVLMPLSGFLFLRMSAYVYFLKVTHVGYLHVHLLQLCSEAFLRVRRIFVAFQGGGEGVSGRHCTGKAARSSHFQWCMTRSAREYPIFPQTHWQVSDSCPVCFHTLRRPEADLTIWWFHALSKSGLWEEN